MDFEALRPFIYTMGIIMLISFALFLLFIMLAVWQVRRLNIPPDADFKQTMRLAPLSIVLAIDLLDLSLDFLAAPIAWLILDRLGLKALRGISVIETAIPGTQFIPTLTLCWLGVRLLRL